MVISQRFQLLAMWPHYGLLKCVLSMTCGFDHCKLSQWELPKDGSLLSSNVGSYMPDFCFFLFIEVKSLSLVHSQSRNWTSPSEDVKQSTNIFEIITFPKKIHLLSLEFLYCLFSISVTYSLNFSVHQISLFPLSCGGNLVCWF